MEPFNARLHTVVMNRWDGMDDDERRATITFLTCDRPATVVRAMNQAQRLAEEVEETLRA
jgi:sortase (surface protein transpeptidase)